MKTRTWAPFVVAAFVGLATLFGKFCPSSPLLTSGEGSADGSADIAPIVVPEPAVVPEPVEEPAPTESGDGSGGSGEGSSTLI